MLHKYSSISVNRLWRVLLILQLVSEYRIVRERHHWYRCIDYTSHICYRLRTTHLLNLQKLTSRWKIVREWNHWILYTSNGELHFNKLFINDSVFESWSSSQNIESFVNDSLFHRKFTNSSYRIVHERNHEIHTYDWWRIQFHEIVYERLVLRI